jgi:peptidoglycan/xylan/chitin deacetylase (PgdA/CDA1 family)
LGSLVRLGFGRCSWGWILAALVAFGLSPATAAASLVAPSDDTQAPSTSGPARDEYPLSVQQREAPFVEAAEPVGNRVPTNAAILVTFSQPMSHRTVERSFDIRPHVEGRLSWVDDFTIRFQPFRLAHAVSYELDLDGRSVRGVPLTGTRAWGFTTVAGPPVALSPGSGAVRVPVLMYHYIRVNPDPRDRLGFALSVTPSDFVAQMDWLAANGYHPITFRDLHAYLAGAAGLPSRPVVLTFDDGYEDFYTTALPVLIGHDFKAVSYVVSGFIGRSGYMNAAQIREADRADIEIGSHTVDHADLTRQSLDGLRYQIISSKRSLEQLLGHDVISFCYPSGRFNPSAVSVVQEAGYSNATTTGYGFVRTMAGRFLWGRLRISGGESLGDFAADVLRIS